MIPISVDKMAWRADYEIVTKCLMLGCILAVCRYSVWYSGVYLEPNFILHGSIVMFSISAWMHACMHAWKELECFHLFLTIVSTGLTTGCRQVMVMNVHACSHDAFNYLFNHIYQLVTDFVRCVSLIILQDVTTYPCSWICESQCFSEPSI